MIISTCLSCKTTWKDRKMIVETWSFVSRLYSHFDGLTSSLQCKSSQLNVLTIRKIEVRSAIYSRSYLSSYHNCVDHTLLHWKKTQIRIFDEQKNKISFSAHVRFWFWYIPQPTSVKQRGGESQRNHDGKASKENHQRQVKKPRWQKRPKRHKSMIDIIGRLTIKLLALHALHSFWHYLSAKQRREILNLRFQRQRDPQQKSFTLCLYAETVRF